MLSKLKQLCGDFRMKSSCMSSCCDKTNANIDIDLDGDGETDIHIGVQNGKIDIQNPPTEPKASKCQKEKEKK